MLLDVLAIKRKHKRRISLYSQNPSTQEKKGEYTKI